MSVTYPKAEQLAKTMQLPVTYDRETFELYGYKVWVLDATAASMILFQNQIYQTSEAFTAAINILEHRISLLN